ncbi:hypothetical protein D3C87_241500 [compost metagenome]
MKNIFDYKSYKPYLADHCDQERGLLTRLSEAGGCQKSYLSACLKGKNQITLDHAFGMAELLGLSDSEQNYFFLLIEKEKANTPKLKRHLEMKLKDLSREAYRLKNQQANAVIVTETASDLGAYYSTWLATAIHTLTSIGGLQSVSQIAKRLNISPEHTQGLLQQLEKLDLVKRQGEKYIWNSGNIHLADNSTWISQHHSNWRLRAIDSTQRRTAEAMHYTAIQSMSEEDFEVLKKKIAQFINEFNKVSDPSEPQDGFCFSIDFFKV